MRKRLLILLLMLCVPPAGLAESSVWRATQGKNVVYLAGSIHVLRTTDYPLPGEFDAAFKDSEQLALEMDPAEAQGLAAQQMLLARGMYPPNETIKNHLSPPLYRRLEDYCRTHGVPLASVAQMRPWLLTMTLGMTDMMTQGFDPGAGVDMHYSQLAAEQGKPIHSLETLDQQMNALASFDGAADPLVANYLEEAETSKQTMAEMLDAWRRGDAARLDRLVSRELRDKYPAVYRTLLVERTRRWLAPVEGWANSGKRVLVIVGSAHLVGDDGLLALLRARGYKVEQLNVGGGQAAPGGL